MTNFARRHGLPEQLENLERRLYELERRLGAQVGSATVVLTNQSTNTVHVDFVDAFETVPEVVATPGLNLYGINRFNLTTTGFDLRVHRTDNANVTANVACSWIAMEATQ